MTFKRTTITAALLYANGPVHIGHLAGCYFPADIYARYLRQRGEDVIFVTGSDEHGVPITIKAQKEGLTPQQVVDKYHAIIKDTFEAFGISPDIYSRTSNPVHHQTSQDFFKTLYKSGQFTEQVTEQFYDEKAQRFLADRYIIGTCPVCSNENAYGDQCEKCGSTLSPEELINPRSAFSGDAPIKKPTKNWYLPLDKLQPFLEKYVNSHPEWKPNVFGQCQSWLKEGLKPRAMTRDLEWGVKVPLENTDGKVLYVWFDAPIGYISMTKELFEKASDDAYLKKYNIGIRAKGWGSTLVAKNTAEAKADTANTWEIYWKSPDTRLVHFIGKDNIVFHCLIFPAMCHVHGQYILANQVPANEFLNLEGDKISTSRNWAVWAHEYLQDFPGKQDSLRYFLTANAPETKDNNFTWKDFQTAHNSELVGILGNFVNRTLVLIDKYYQRTVPEVQVNMPEAVAVLQAILPQRNTLYAALDKFKFREAISELMNLARMGNKFLADTEPWKRVKDKPEETKQILFVSLQITAHLAHLMEPFMPFTSKKLKHILNDSTAYSSALNPILIHAGHTTNAPELLFDKIEDTTIEAQIAKLNSTKSAQITANNELPTMQSMVQSSTKSYITFDDFSKMDIRIGTITEAEKVEKADKLLKLKVNIGSETRTIISGIALHYTPEQIIGKQVCVLTNLEPRKLKGIESQGMVLMAEDEAGKLVFVSPEANVTNGSEVR